MTSNAPRSLEAGEAVTGGTLWPDGPPRYRHLIEIAHAALERDADAPFVVFREHAWTRRNIARWGRAIAGAILHGLGEEEDNRRVALLVGRGPQIVAGMVGILEAGCVIVPIDAGQPPERIKTILADAAPSIVLVDDAQIAAASFDLSDRQMLEIPPLELEDSPACLPLRRSAGSDAAYLLYTSGSTGSPKGVLCNHLGLCNLIEDRLAERAMTSEGRLLLTTSISFDPAIYDIFLALASGGRLIIADEAAAVSGDALADLMRRQSITHLDMPPSLLAAIPPGSFPELEVIFLGGEPAPRRLIDEWARRTMLENCYGPTETSIEVMRWRWSAGEPGNRIGRPIRNVTMRIINEDGSAGEEGELWVGGPMVALGYLGLPDETAERFVLCPETGLRFYRTGDRVRKVADNLYDYLGRMDDQVKIAGMRIEPEEVRAAIEATPGVLRAALVTEQSPQGVTLTAFYQRAPGGSDRAGLMDQLSRRLPPAMIPARLVEVETLPVLVSGKTDIEALKREWKNGGQSVETGDKSEVARTLTALWRKLLNVADVKLSDNFFELGGDSLRLTQMIFAINKTYRIRLTPAAYRALNDLGALILHVETALADREGQARQ